MADPTAPESTGAEPEEGGASRKGRPSKLSYERVRKAIDELEARDGEVPSVRELQTLLGGGRSKLSALREQILAERLVSSAAPVGENGSAKAVATAVSAALTVLAKEALRGADRVVGQARRDAEERIALSEKVQAAAARSVETATLERERAAGQVTVLERQVDDGRLELDQLHEVIKEAEQRIHRLDASVDSLRSELAEQHQLTTQSRADFDALRTNLDASKAAYERERVAREAAERLAELVARERDMAIAARDADAKVATTKLTDVVRTLDSERVMLRHTESERSQLAEERQTLHTEVSRLEKALEQARATAATLTSARDAAVEALDAEREMRDTRFRSIAEMLSSQRTMIRALVDRLEAVDAGSPQTSRTDT